MADINVDIKSDASGNTVRFRSSGTHPLPPSAGKAMVVTGTPASGGVVAHGTVSGSAAQGPGIVFDNPA
jgi:hypothetical protein